MFITENRMAPWPAALRGRLEKVTVASELLRGNPLGDPHERPLRVYLPPDYPDQTRRFPSVYLLPGYGGSAASWASRPAYGRPVLEMIAGRTVAAHPVERQAAPGGGRHDAGLRHAGHRPPQSPVTATPGNQEPVRNLRCAALAARKA